MERKNENEIDEKDKKIIQLRESGLSQREIGIKMGISTSTVSKRIQKIKRLTGQEIKRPWEQDDFEEKIIVLRKQELSIGKIAKLLNVGYNKIASRLIEIQESQGIQLPNGHKKAGINNIDIRIKEYIEQGLKQYEIASILGITHQRVSQRKQKMERLLQIKILPIKNLDETDEIILDLMNKQMTKRQIANKVNLSLKKVYSRIKKIEKIKNIKFPRHSAGRIQKIDEIDKQIIELLEKGLSQQKVADTLEYKLGSIRRRMDKIEKLLDIRLPRKARGRKSNSNVGILFGKRASSIGNISIQDKDEKREELLIKGIANLQKTKNASIEQLKQMGEYYNIDFKKLQDAIDKEKDER